MAEFNVNKGIGRSPEFKGLKSQYLFIFAGGLLALFVIFVVMYMAGIDQWVCIGKNALQSDGIKRGSPPSRLENQPARTGRNRRRNKMEKIKRRKLIGINGDGWRRGIGR